jgi:putative ABC transport system substrate-binding protein
MIQSGTFASLLFRIVGPFIRAPLALAALLLIVTLWTDASWAQTKIPRVGILSVGWSDQANMSVPAWIAPFYRTLREHGWVEGDNVAFVHLDSGGDPTRLPQVAAEIVRLKVDVLFPVGRAATRAAFAATRDIPIVAHDLDTDPLAAGYAKSYSHPGGHLTGVFLDAPEVAGKWLELLKTIVPDLSRVVVLWDPSEGSVHVDAVRKAARALGVRTQFVEVNTPADIDKAPSAFRGHPQAMIILPSPMMWFQSPRLVQLEKKYRLPATSMLVPFAEAGGMLVYGPDMASTFEQCGVLVAKVLSGAKPEDLPAERPDKFEFVLNLNTAKFLRLTVPDTILLRADKIIE